MYETKTMEFIDHKTFYDRMIRIANAKGPYSVVTQGDCWIPNFLLRYDKSIPVEGKMIDFQMCRYASPVLDISAFIYCNTSQNLRENHYTELLQVITVSSANPSKA